MFDLGWTELLIIGVVALIVVGPKDLPKMFRTLGQMTAKARAMAREFSRAMEDAADQTGVKDVARDLRDAANPQGMGLDELKKFKNWDPTRDDASATPDPEEAEGAGLDKAAADVEKMREASRARRAAQASPDTPDAAEPSDTRAAPPEDVQPDENKDAAVPTDKTT